MNRSVLRPPQPIYPASLALACAAILFTCGCEIKVEQPASEPPPAIRVPAAQAAVVAAGKKLEQQQEQNSQTEQPSPAAAKALTADSNKANAQKSAHRPQTLTTNRQNSASMSIRLSIALPPKFATHYRCVKRLSFCWSNKPRNPNRWPNASRCK